MCAKVYSTGTMRAQYRTEAATRRPQADALTDDQPAAGRSALHDFA